MQYKNHKLVFLGVLLSSLVSACTSFGDHSIAALDAGQVDAYITDGTTSMADVQAKFGTTTTTQRSDSGQMWYYSAVNHHIVTASIKTLAVYFDSNGIVTRHYFSEKNQQVASRP